MSRRRQRYTTFEPSLPPYELRREEFRGPNHDRIQTPLTEVGLVDTPRLLKAVNATLLASYDWPTKPDDHHLYWPSRWYPRLEAVDAAIDPYAFRNLPINRLDLPRSFHNHLHNVTLPPPIPNPDTMHDVSTAQNCIGRMYRTAQRAQRLLRTPEVSDATIDSRLEELFDEYQQAYEELLTLPPEFHFIDTRSDAVHDTYDLLVPKRDLGRYAMRTTVSYAAKYIRRPRPSGDDTDDPQAA